MKSKKPNSKNDKKDTKNTKEILLEITDGVLATVAEIVLAELFFGLNLLVAGSYSGSVYRASKATDELFGEVKAKTVQRACHRLKREGYITYIKGKNVVTHAKLTKEGLKRIKDSLPQYKKKRPWDGRLYLITYDVPEKRRKDRNLLRHLLKKLGCGLLQQSVWITPYNPRGILEEIVKEYGIVGDIIVSDTGKEGSVGKTNFKELMERVYNLGEINDRYAEFIEMCQTKGWKFREQAVFRFLSIVADDPQLPYELLPEEWLGDEAYTHFQHLEKGDK